MKLITMCLFSLLIYSGDVKMTYQNDNVMVYSSFPVITAQLSIEEWVNNTYVLTYQSEYIVFYNNPVNLVGFATANKIKVTLNYHDEKGFNSVTKILYKPNSTSNRL